MSKINNKSMFRWITGRVAAEKEFIVRIKSVLARAGMTPAEVRRTVEPMVSFNRKRLNQLKVYGKRRNPGIKRWTGKPKR